MRNDGVLVPQDWLKLQVISVRVPLPVFHAVTEMRERAEKAGFVFDVQTVMVAALERALKEANGQLKALEQGVSPETMENAPKRRRNGQRGLGEMGTGGG